MCGVASTASERTAESPPVGSTLKNVQRRARHFARFDGRQQRRFVHQFAARAVHDAHARSSSAAKAACESMPCVSGVSATCSVM
jgi:hypothetical protein